AAARFDCQGCGQTGGSLSKTTLSGRVEEIRAVRDYLLADSRLTGPVLFLGSSFGGTAALLLAAREPGGAGVVAWSTPSDFSVLEKRRASIEEQPLDQTFFDDVRAIDLLKEVQGLSPCLIVHGQDDQTVPLEQAYRLAQALGQPSRLVVINGADHALTTSGAVDLALAETMAWLENLSLTSGRQLGGDAGQVPVSPADPAAQEKAG
ncbi:MAG: prolyl oligopeptidase family serine peptidase, partial [Deltaproteobacteria bacterium]|nr:prolyl oligopeptidase family serine peptidase [Deltaproteobacteria bacterium]